MITRYIQTNHIICKYINVQRKHTLNWAAIEENFVDLVVSSGKGGKSPETKEHLEAQSSAACSGTT